MHLFFHPLRFTFIARDPIYFPPGKSANILRGAFGIIFRKIACVPECVAASSCPQRATCAYAQVFEPSAPPGSPSGFGDLPRPFVFRAWHLDAQMISVGQEFHFDLNLFDTKTPTIAYLVLAFAQLAREGLGPRRSRVELTGVWQMGLDGQPLTRIFDGSSFTVINPTPLSLELGGPAEPVLQVRLRFVTPTELKRGDGMAATPEFAVLAARIRDRVSMLGQMYSSELLGIDFRAFGERAKLIEMTRCNVRRIEVERKSSRTAQVHSIGGFVGDAEYEGELAEFVPYLKAAMWTGVGRQTVWGKGEIRIG